MTAAAPAESSGDAAPDGPRAMSRCWDERLDVALAAVREQWDAAGYGFVPVPGATMATVWRGTRAGGPEVAVRLTPKPAALIRRIAVLVDDVQNVACPATHAVAGAEIDGRTWTVQVCEWIGNGAASRHNPRRLGQALARLHSEFARLAPRDDFTDRPVTFEPAPIPDAADPAPWAIARRLWDDRLDALAHADLHVQPVHGDLHLGNVVSMDGGDFGFVDFDKTMCAPAVYDVAKMLATSFFHVDGDGRAVFDQDGARELVASYCTVRELGPVELTALVGYMLSINQQTARLGLLHGNDAYLREASAVGTWWTAHPRAHDPLGLRSLPSPSRSLPSAVSRSGEGR